jgi:hypothetical protein
MECQICSVLEAIRCDRIMKYVRLVEQMKRSKRPSAKLQAEISNLRSEADEAWKRLDAHRREHAFGLQSSSAQTCQYCGGAETLLSNNGRPICEHCAADLEARRKPPQREKFEVKTRAATAG